MSTEKTRKTNGENSLEEYLKNGGKLLSVMKVVSDSETGEELCREPLGSDPWDDALLSLLGENMTFAAKLAAANAGSVLGMMMTGEACFNGDDTEVNFEEAFRWFGEAAIRGNATAQFNVGLFYAKGFLVERDLEKAAKWMDLADENGDEDAANCARQYRAAIRDRDRAEKGDADAAASLATFYMGLAGSLCQAGPSKDYAESLKWAEAAAAAGNAEGLYLLGLAYEHGRGVETDMPKAVGYYKKGVDLGHPGAMCNYAVCILNGHVADAEEKDAFGLTLCAAEHGFDQAMYNVARMYQFGSGVEDDMQKAIEWYEKYLQVHPDDELREKVDFFKMMTCDQDEEGDESEESSDGFAAFFSSLREMIDYLAKVGPEHGFECDEDAGLDGLIGFTAELAENGDEEAARILNELRENEPTPVGDDFCFDEDEEFDEDDEEDD